LIPADTNGIIAFYDVSRYKEAKTPNRPAEGEKPKAKPETTGGAHRPEVSFAAAEYPSLSFSEAIIVQRLLVHA